VTTETATLLAVLAAPIAVLAVVAAVAVGMIARRGRQGLGRSATGLERQEAALRGDLESAQGSIEGVAAALTALRTQGHRLDADLVTWAAGLSEQRRTIEGLNRSRLGPAVRAVQLAGAIARIALLWRTPAR